MPWSDQCDQIATSLAKAQNEFEIAKFDTENPHFRNRFASYAALVKASKALAKHGICFSHEIIQNDDGKWMVTQLTHSSGQWFRSFFPMPVDKSNMQGMGSANSYAKRYSLANALGLATEDAEDDGTEATKHAPAPQESKPKQSGRALAHLLQTVQKYGVSSTNVTALIKEMFGKNSSKELTDNELDQLSREIEERSEVANDPS